jgi:uncharacterized membrane protein (UPF0127 family)
MRFWTALFAFLLLVPGLGPTPAPGQTNPVGPLEPLEIVTKSGVRSFQVEMARTDEELSRGLMYRRELPEGRGMLFDFRQDRPVGMWMKNTYISLDMLFIRSDGTIIKIAERTKPHSLENITSGLPVRAVLEIVGGSARTFGIRPGDKVVHPMFGNR